jgi:glutamine cyclotransferase
MLLLACAGLLQMSVTMMWDPASVNVDRGSPKGTGSSGDDRDVDGRRLGAEESPITDTYVSSYRIVNTFDHDTEGFTQGLVFDEHGTLYSSDGLYGKSRVRTVDVLTGKSTHVTPNDVRHFAEGIAIVGDKLLQLTWKNKKINEFSKKDLKLLRTRDFPVGKEGWGLAYDGEVLHVTDSTNVLLHVDPTTYKQLQMMLIVDPKLNGADGHPNRNFSIYGVNELEMVQGELWGNVYPSASACSARPSTVRPSLSIANCMQGSAAQTTCI